MIDVERRLFTDGNDHNDFLITPGEMKKTKEATGIESFHGASVEAERFGGDHKIFAGE